MFNIMDYSLLSQYGSSSSDALAIPFMCGFQMIFWIFYCGIIILSLVGMALWIWMLIDVAQRKFEVENDKTLWLLIVILGGGIGALIYYFMIKKKDQ
jgi:hypothetical protein